MADILNFHIQFWLDTEALHFHQKTCYRKIQHSSRRIQIHSFLYVFYSSSLGNRYIRHSSHYNKYVFLQDNKSFIIKDIVYT